MFSTTKLVELTGAARPNDRIGGAISRAAQRTGVDFTYLFNQAKVESGLNPTAKARTSSATGLFQFIDQTWLGTVKKHGSSHGLGWAADSISRGSDGRYRVADGATRRAILDLRNQPEAASAMAAEFASDNQSYLESRLGRRAEPVDLYLAHFLGAGGATQFLAAHDANPHAPAAPTMPQAAGANRPVFYHRSGAAKSFAEIRDNFAAKMGGGSPAPLPPSLGLGAQEFIPVRMALLEVGQEQDRDVEPLPLQGLPLNTAAVQKLPSPQHARLAYLMLADLGA